MRGDDLRELGVDDLVDHDPGRDHPVRRARRGRRSSTTTIPREPQAQPGSRRRARDRAPRSTGAHTSPASRARRTSSVRSSRPTSGGGLGDPHQHRRRSTASPPAASSSAATYASATRPRSCSRRTYARAARAELGAVVGGELERGRDRRHLVLVDRDPQRHAVRQLGEPADVGDEHRLAERRARGSPSPTSRPSSASAGSRARRRRPSATEPLLARRSPRGSARRRRARAARAGGRGRTARSPRRRAAAARRAAARAAARTPRAAAGSACSCSGGRSSRRAGRRGRPPARPSSLGPGRVRDPPERPAVAGRRARRARRSASGRSGPSRQVEHRAGEREALGLRSPRSAAAGCRARRAPSRRPGDPEVALHRVEVAAAVAAADRDAGDQVVEHELVQDDDAGPLARARRRSSRARRGRCRRGRARRRPRGARLPGSRDDDLVDPLPQRRQEQRRVVGDPGARGGSGE